MPRSSSAFYVTSLFIGWRYLRGRSGDRFSRFVSMMSTAGVTIGVLSLVTVVSVMNGFEGNLKSKILGVLPQAVVMQTGDKTDASQGVPEFLEQLPQVTHIQPIVRSDMVLQSPTHLSAGILIGVEPSADEPTSNVLFMGSIYDLQPQEYNIVLGHSMARQLGVTVGDKVRVMVTSASQYTPLGRIPSQRNFTVSGVYNSGSDIDGTLAVVNIEDAGRLLRHEKETITGWRLFFNDPFVASSMGDKITLPDGWKWTDWREQRGEFFQAVKMERNMMGMMLALIIAIAAFNIISALVIVVMEKQSEIAILKTQGMTRSQIMAIFMFQGASSGILGALFGGILGIIFALNLNDILDLLSISIVPGGLPVIIKPFQIVVILFSTILLTLLATLYPSYSASAVKPAETLRYE